jgi:hypothetical protein
MILVIGKIPPPIGGVTIYVSRLLKKLSKTPYEFNFLKLNIFNMLFPYYHIFNSKVVHLIASHPLIRLYISVLCLMFKKKIIITYTDNFNGFSNSFYNYSNRLSLKISSHPIVLNKKSLEICKKINTKTKLISAFIPPEINDSNLDNLKKELDINYKKFDYIFCTNAFSFCLDKFNNELYGIIPLVSLFNNLNTKILIICDPSGTYKTYFEKHKIILGKNIKLLSNNVFSFIDVVKLSDCLIRATTTDGDSLSIHEAFYLNKNVITSDCVDRPPNCILYKNNDFSKLNEVVSNYQRASNLTLHKENRNGFDYMLDVYSEIIK